MIDKVYIDANFFVSSKLKDHNFYLKATNKVQELGNSHLYFSLLTLDEIIHAFTKYKTSKKQIIRTVKRDIVNAKGIFLINYSTNTNEVDQSVKLWKSSGLKPRDALHLYLMKSNGIKKIATFDGDFIKKQKDL